MGAEQFKHRLAIRQSGCTGYAPARQVESWIREAAPQLSRHQATTILRQLPMNSAQQVSVEALFAALGL